MAFSLHNFIMTGLRDAVGKLSDFQVILNALGWLEKQVLTESDLAELQSLIDAKNAPVEKPVEEDPVEELA